MTPVEWAALKVVGWQLFELAMFTVGFWVTLDWGFHLPGWLGVGVRVTSVVAIVAALPGMIRATRCKWAEVRAARRR